MKIAIIGGTGKMGAALAAQLSKRHEVYIGSRDPAKAERAAAGISGARPGDEMTVSAACDVAILAIPYEAVGRLGTLEEALGGKLVISPVVPMTQKDGLFYYAAREGSAAEEVASRLRKSRVAAALHTLPFASLLDNRLEETDVMVAADSRETFRQAAEVVESLEKVRPIFVGPLSMASSVERLTPLLLNAAKLNGMKTPSVRLIHQEKQDNRFARSARP